MRVVLLLAGLLGHTYGMVDVIKVQNNTQEKLATFPSTDARFGGALDENGLLGIVVKANNTYGCSRIQEAPKGQNYIALIERGGTNCTFTMKVRHAQEAGFAAAIVYDDEDSSDLVIMESDSDHNIDIGIPSVFVSQTSGHFIIYKLHDSEDGTILVQLWPEMYAPRSFLMTFVTIIAGVSIIFTLFLFYRRHTILHQHARPKVRMTRRQALKLAKRSFIESDADETCCICLEQYSRGDTITTLPCNHFFHQGCIRPWLQEQQRVCPICKRDPVVPNRESESTPLLSPNPSDLESGHGSRAGSRLLDASALDPALPINGEDEPESPLGPAPIRRLSLGSNHSAAPSESSSSSGDSDDD
eukprot:m.162143 g.162143  ORF g.162143 m.162143 type:complete len:358 (-) comp12149_c0_seq1:83-1156(-)